MLGALFSVDNLTGFEITKLVELPEPYGIIVLWGFVLPTVYVMADAIAKLLFKDALILKVGLEFGRRVGWVGRRRHCKRMVALSLLAAWRVLGPGRQKRLRKALIRGCLIPSPSTIHGPSCCAMSHGLPRLLRLDLSCAAPPAPVGSLPQLQHRGHHLLWRHPHRARQPR